MYKVYSALRVIVIFPHLCVVTKSSRLHSISLDSLNIRGHQKGAAVAQRGDVTGPGWISSCVVDLVSWADVFRAPGRLEGSWALEPAALVS